MKKLIMFLLLFNSAFCQVPNTTTFSLSDVSGFIGCSGDLSSCFSSASSLRFDPAYNSDSYAPANSLLRFRNYGALHYLGEQYGGGTVIYVDAYNHGLIASNVNINDGADQFLRWYNGANRALCYTFQGIGYGMANTTNIISTIGASGVAATKCRAYTGGGYMDWYLPSQDEMGWLIYCKRIGIFTAGFITGVSYALWTSTEQGAVYAIAYNDSPLIWAEDDYLTHHVRAMRSF
jgi:hypothetical protein